MTRISYERDEKAGSDCNVHMEGSGAHLLEALVHIVIALENGFGLNVDRLCTTLPTLVRLEKSTIDHVSKIDMEAIARAKEGGK